MKKLATLLGLLAVFAVGAQAQTGSRQFTANATTHITPDRGIGNIGSGIAYHQLSWNAISAVASCMVKLQQSTDDSTWSDLISDQDCSTTGQSTVVNVSTNYVRINVDTFTGAGSVVVLWNGFNVNPSGGGTIGGSIANTQVAIGSGVDTISGSNNFLYVAGQVQLIPPTDATTAFSIVGHSGTQSAPLANFNNGASDGPFGLFYIAGNGLTDSLGDLSLLELRIPTDAGGNVPLTMSNASATPGIVTATIANNGDEVLAFINSAGEMELESDGMGTAFLTGASGAYWDSQINGQLDAVSGGNKPIVLQGAVSDGGEVVAGISGCGTVTSQIGGAWVGSFVAQSVSCTITITPGATMTHGFFCKAEDLSTPADTIHQTAYTTTTCSMDGTTVIGDLITFYLLGF